MSDLRLSARASLRARLRAYLDCEAGNATLWSLTWLLGFGIMAGLAIDSTNGWRNKTMLQATADAAALAGAIELPNPLRDLPYDSTEATYEPAREKALEYADRNLGMEDAAFGEYLRAGDIVVGNYDRDRPPKERFIPGADFDDEFPPGEAPPVNAVNLLSLQNESERGNGVPTALLHMIGLQDWEVATRATAMKGIHECWRQGFMSRGRVCQQTESHWYPGWCIYGDTGIHLRPNNTWSDHSQAVLPEDAENGIDSSNEPPNQIPGLEVIEGEMLVPLVDKIPQIAQRVLAGDIYYAHPSFDPTSLKIVELKATNITGNRPDDEPEEMVLDDDGSDGTSGGSSDSSSTQCKTTSGSQVSPPPDGYDPLALVASDNRPSGAPWTDSVLERHRIYYHDGTAPISISGDVRDVVIVSWGGFRLKQGSDGSSLENVTLISLDQAKNATAGNSIAINQIRIGNVDPCWPGGEVLLYTMGSIGGPAHAEFYGTTLVAGGSIEFAAQLNAMYGIAAFAAGDIHFTSGNQSGSVTDENYMTGSEACVLGTYVPIPDDQMRISLVE